MQTEYHTPRDWLAAALPCSPGARPRPRAMGSPDQATGLHLLATMSVPLTARCSVLSPALENCGAAGLSGRAREAAASNANGCGLGLAGEGTNGTGRKETRRILPTQPFEDTNASKSQSPPSPRASCSPPPSGSGGHPSRPTPFATSTTVCSDSFYLSLSLFFNHSGLNLTSCCQIMG